MKATKLIASIAFAAFAVVCTVRATNAQTAPTVDPKIEKKQKEVRKMAHDTLQRLYKAEPLTRAAIKASAGYAVFSNKGVKILVAGSGKGQGVAVNKKSQKETFMKMLEVQAGLGMGVKKFQVIFIFDNDNAFRDFVESGWQFGGQTTAAAKGGETGGAVAGAVSVSDGVWMYQLTEKGLALEITAKGTKYYKDDDLNK
jgi:lipid-binding SYLF domain-containing protein